MSDPRHQSRSDQAGAREAVPDDFVALYREAYPRLTLIAASISGDRAQAEDIVQEAAMIAVEKADRFVPGSSIAAWLSAIVRRCALNHRRKTLGRRTFAADPLRLAELTAKHSASESWPIAADTGELISGQDAFDDEVLRALESLSDHARCCLLLRTVQALSYAEIAELLQIPEGTAMSHVHRSKDVLRQKLLSTELAELIKPET